ncbi:hypothetical protein [Pseudalkalibacillus decolorationis]|uniref:hypothetical protein n=1 Tax=Pseudalkalibacillus decolorationis TaxID=163879 RepID=UPI0021495C33|nr:hypothetical protein [Pseudalkalibacillus decolorationis]
MIWLWFLIPLLVVITVAIVYEYRNRKRANVQFNSKEFQERPFSQQEKQHNDQKHYGVGGEGNQPPPT